MLAEEIITRFHNEEAAKGAHKSAGNQVALGAIPDNVPEVEVALAGREDVHIVSLLREAGLAQNGKAAKDVFARGAVYIDGVQLSGDRMFIEGDVAVIQAGKKKIAKISIIK